MTPQELKTKRRELGLTQQQLADKIGYTVRQVNKYENDWIDIPQVVEMAINSLKGRGGSLHR